jgi:beta-lactam-binding protein with PASTA domain
MKQNIRKTFWFNLLVVLSLFVVLYISFFATLSWVTKHGEEVKIPDVRGMDMNNAIAQLKGMHFEIYIDSTYELTLKPLTVLKQVPDSGSSVKEGRTVFLTVNMLTPPHIPMPNLVNLSFRSAEMLLRNNKLLLGDTTYKPDIAGGAILEQKYKGEVINAGEMIAQGSKISLVIGDGLGNTQFDVPGVTGSSVDEAMTTLNQYSLQIDVQPVNQMAEITDTSAAMVVCQDPMPVNAAGAVNKIKAGDLITIFIAQNPAPEDYCNNNGNTKGALPVNSKDNTKKDNNSDQNKN